MTCQKMMSREPGALEHLRHLLKAVWQDYRQCFRDCRADFSTDSVHDLRVASRRLLALLTVLEATIDVSAVPALRRLVRKRLRRLARLRDLQVQLLAVDRQATAFPAANPFRKALAKQEHRASALAHRLRLGGIRPAMAAVRKSARRAWAGPNDEARQSQALRRAVDRAFGRVTARLAGCRADDLESIHRLRVAFKRFRYMVELLQPLLPGVADDEIKALREIHNQMGRIQDARVLAASLDSFCHDHPRHAAALRRCSEASHRRCARLARAFLAEAGCIRGFAPRQITRREEHAAIIRC